MAGFSAKDIYPAINELGDDRLTDAKCLTGILFQPETGVCRNKRCGKTHDAKDLLSKDARRRVLMHILDSA